LFADSTLKATISLLLFFTQVVVAQEFDRSFVDKTMRIDLHHTGTKGTETLALDKVYEEGPWPGSRTQLLDRLNLGEYMLRVYDVATAMMIYSRGYSTMFNEWQTTEEALAGIYRTFHETVRIPFPKNRVQVTVSRRDKQMIFHQIFSTVIDPSDPTEVNKQKRTLPFASSKILDNGVPHQKVDLLILGDGYTRTDMAKFRKDAQHFTDALFSVSPFKERKKDFNVWIIEVESRESGIDKPDKNEWKENALGTMYNTFGSARYILTEENRIIRDIAGALPYDALAILCNDNRYGGGGIYNLYTTCYTQVDAKGQEWQMDYVFVHELGHSFAGLGDEYYSSQISYVDFYSKGVEPWEPNITALNDPANVKWKAFLTPNIPIPTPWNKSAYDSLEALRGKLDRLAPDYYEKREPLYRQAMAILQDPAHAGKVGAYEGAGYVSQGLYRPSLNCRMFSLSLVGFDPVCRAAIERVIDSYVK
jgi:hypothetical protein